MKGRVSRDISLKIGILILFVTLVLGFFATFYASSVMLKSQEESIKKLSQEAAAHVEAIINGRLALLEEVASREDVISMDWEKQKASLADDIEAMGYLEILVVDVNGDAHYVSTGDIVNLSDRTYFQRALAGESCVSDVLVSKSTNTAAIYYATPIKQDGKIVGVIVGKRDGDALNEITESLGTGERGYAFIIGEEGTFYAYPDAEKVLNQYNVFTTEEETYKDFANAFQNRGTDGNDVLHYTLNGEARITGIAAVANTSWILAIGNYESEVIKDINSMRLYIIIFAAVVLMIGLIIGTVTGQNISKPVIYLKAQIDQMASYDFTFSEGIAYQKVNKRRDEIGQMVKALFQMRGNFIELLQEVSTSAEHIASSSEELTATSQQSAQAAQDVAASIGVIAEGADMQMSETKISSNNLQELNHYMQTSDDYHKVLNDALLLVNRMQKEGMVSVGELKQNNEVTIDYGKNIQETIYETADSIEKIDKASNMIQSISNQTNLLALNAAIEAARAGEAGRGFAVVANEIKNLADESNRFTAEITTIVKELITKTKEAVAAANGIQDIMEVQTEKVNETNIKFHEIEQSIDKMSSDLESINKINPKIMDCTEAVSRSIEALSGMSGEYADKTQSGSAAVEEQTAAMDEIANASEALAELAEILQIATSKFKF